MHGSAGGWPSGVVTVSVDGVCGACGGGTSRITPTGLGLLVELDVAVDVSYNTQCQLRLSSLSISDSAVHFCSSMKTRCRIIMPSLKTVGFVLGV
jgi:hypothetical protein